MAKASETETETETDLLAHGIFTRSMVVDRKAADEKKRSIPVIASTDAVDGHKEVVDQDFILERFNANPIYLWDHNRYGQADTEPLGHAENIRVEDINSGRRALMMDLIHATADINPRAERVFRSFLAGHQRAVSIGFRPRRVYLELDNGEEIWHLAQNELFEISATPMGSNPETLGQRSLARRRAALLDIAKASGAEIDPTLEAQITSAMASTRVYSLSSGLTPGAEGRQNQPEGRGHDLGAATGPQETPTPPAKTGAEGNQVDPKDAEIKSLKEAVETTTRDRVEADRQKAEIATTLETRTAELSAEREKSLRLETELTEARKESEQRKTLLDAAETRANAAQAESDANFAKLVDQELKALSGQKIMPDEMEMLKSLSVENPKMYAEQIARVHKRKDLPFLKSDVIPEDGGAPPVTGGEQPRAKTITERLAEKRSGKITVGAING